MTKEEYESRVGRYDKQLREKTDFDPEGKSTAEKMKVLREYREDQYLQVMNAAYKRKGWDENGVPTVERLKELGIDIPELVEIIENAG